MEYDVERERILLDSKSTRKFLQIKICYYQPRGRDHYQYALEAVAQGDRTRAIWEQREAKYHYEEARNSLIELIQMGRDSEWPE